MGQAILIAHDHNSAMRRSLPKMLRHLLDTENAGYGGGRRTPRKAGSKSVATTQPRSLAPRYPVKAGRCCAHNYRVSGLVHWGSGKEISRRGAEHAERISEQSWGEFRAIRV